MNLRKLTLTTYVATPLALLFLSFPAFGDDSKKPAQPAKPAAKGAPAKPNGSKPSGPTAASKPAGPTTNHPGPTTAHPTTDHPTTTHPTTTTKTNTRPTPIKETKKPESSEARRQGEQPKTANQPVARDHTVTQARNGASVEKRPGGAVATLHDPKRGMDVHHTLTGNRRVEVERADHSRIVAERGGRGYVQRPYMYHGREYAGRYSYYNGRYYHNYYGRYYYRGVYVNPYYPAYYYQPAFYGWAYNPWVTPVPYAWGWGGNPWYGYYGAYFTPYPVYAGPSLWLTDYLIATSLQASYAAQLAAAQSAGLTNPAPLTDETKQLIADEVKQQISLENSESQQNGAADASSSSVQRLLTDGKQHVFVAGHDIDVVDNNGLECALSEGDAIQLTGPPAPDAQAASLFVLASKGGKECQRGVTVSVNVTDLQEMQNHMRETIDQGMKELRAKQGKGGLPALPSSAQAAPVDNPATAGAPPPPAQNEVIAQINEQSQQADQAEKEALGGSASPAATQASVDVGQTISQVEAAMGTPSRQAHAGSKTIYFYKDEKVTFTDGKVSDVQ
jgi:hypothetical protein